MPCLSVPVRVVFRFRRWNHRSDRNRRVVAGGRVDGCRPVMFVVL
jgi:hypothetical protein